MFLALDVLQKSTFTQKTLTRIKKKTSVAAARTILFSYTHFPNEKQTFFIFDHTSLTGTTFCMKRLYRPSTCCSDFSKIHIFPMREHNFFMLAIAVRKKRLWLQRGPYFSIVPQHVVEIFQKYTFFQCENTTFLCWQSP